MAIANLLIKIGADISELQVNSDKAVRGIQQTSQKIDSIGSSIRSTLLATFSLGAIASFSQELLRMGDDVVRTADRTGLLTTEVQKLSFIAGQSGNSIEELTSGIGQMQNRLASGDKSALAAVKDLGLSFDTLRTQSPYDQLQDIAAAVAKIPNPAQRAQIAMDLFGKSGIALLPTLTSSFKALGDSAPVMSDNTVRALDAAGDAFDKFTLTIKVWVAESYNQLGKGFDLLIANVYRAVGGLYEGTAKLVQLTAKIPGASRVFGDLTDNVSKLTETSRWYTDAAKGLEAGTQKTAVAAKAAVQPFTALTDRTDRLTESQKKAQSAAEAHAKAIASLRDDLSGRGAIRAAQEMTQALKGISAAEVDASGNTKRVNDAMREAIDVLRVTGQVAPKAFSDWYLATLRIPTVIGGITNELIKMTQQVRLAIPEVEDLGLKFKVVEGVPFGGHIGQEVKLAIPELQKVEDHLDDLARGFSQLAQVSGGAFGEIVQGIGTIIAGADTVKKAFASIQAGQAAGGKSGLLDMASGYLALAGAAVQAGKALRPLLGLHHGKLGDLIGTNRDARIMVENFAAIYGGFDKLHEKLLELGPAGEQMWIQLTQKVDSGKIEQAKAAIDSINTAFDKQQQQLNALNEAMNEYGFTWEDLGEKARGARLADLFTELYDKTQILKDAGIDYHEILLRQSSDYSELVQAAIRTGTEIPASMRPVLEDLIEMGTLVDENGQSFKDLSQVTWAKTLTQGFDQVTQAIYDLTDALTHGVGGALDELGRRTVRIPIKFDVDNTPGGGSVPELATGTRGEFRNFGAGTYVKLHGYERVQTEAEALGVSDGGTVTLSAPDALKLLHGEIVTVTRKDAARGGLRPRAGSGRSY